MSRRGKRTDYSLSQILDSIPKNFDFEYCAVDSTTKRTFSIVNLTQGILKYTIRKADN